MTFQTPRPPRAADAARRQPARRDAATGAALFHARGPRPPVIGVPWAVARTRQGRSA